MALVAPVGAAILAAGILVPTAAARATPRQATIETGAGPIVLDLLEDLAPQHVRSFVRLAGSGFYDGTTFHRILPAYLIQGGSPTSRDADPYNDNFGGPGFNLEPEFTSSSAHVRGVVSMARDPVRPASAGSQFFIVLGDAPMLDEIGFTTFARVRSGLDVADRIAEAPRDRENFDRPLEPVVIRRIVIQGAEAEPEAIPAAKAAPAVARPTRIVETEASEPEAGDEEGEAPGSPVAPATEQPGDILAETSDGAATTPRRVWVVQDGVNVRSGPGVEHRVVARLKGGTELSVRGVEAGWSRVALSDGREGFVRADFLIDGPPGR